VLAHQSFNAMLFESIQVIFDGASTAFEVLNKPVDAVAFAVESDAAQARQVLL
jgi:hypothetical protein